MTDSYKRTPRNYYGNRLPHKDIKTFLPKILQTLEKKAFSTDKMILDSWQEIIGEKLSPMTEAVKFEEGILYIKVRSQVLYSLLVQHERAKLIKLYQKKFPHTPLKNIQFRMG